MNLIKLRTVVLIAAIVLSASAAQAQTYREKGFLCYRNPYGGGGSVAVQWPSLTSKSGVEMVYFAAFLYKLNTTTSQWEVVGGRPATMTIERSTWYWGYVSLGGPISLTLNGPTFYLGSTPQAANPIFQVGPGTYAVLEYYQFTSVPGIYQSWATYQTRPAFYSNSGIYSCTL